MEDQYGVAITNKFSLFNGDEDSDPLEIVKLQQDEAEKLKSLQTAKKAKSTDAKNKISQNQNLKNTGDNAGTVKKFAETKKLGGVSRKENLQNGKLANPVIRPKSADLRYKPDKVILSLQNNQVTADDSVLESNETLITENDLEGFKEKLSRSSRQKQDVDTTNIRPRDNFNSSSSGVFRGRGGSGFRRGMARGRGGFERNNRREFDRHSGNEKSSVKGGEKKDGAGAHNWGSNAEVIEDQVSPKQTKDEVTDEENKDEAHQHTDAIVESVLTPEDQAKQELQEETKVMTLDEWKAIEESKRIKAEFKLRKAGEGCGDDAKWKKMIPLKKKEKDEEDKDGHNEEDNEGDDNESHVKKHILPIEIKFNSDVVVSRGAGSGRGGRGRGGRGGDVGGRGGARKPQQKQQPTPNVDDEKDFPSLS